MHDNDFDHIFRHKFGQLPGQPAREEGWADMSRRLDAHEGRRRNWLIPVLLPLTGLLACGNVFWWYQWREATREMAASRTTVVQNDTIVRKNIVYQYDTIYKTLAVYHRPGSFADFPASVKNTFGAPSAAGNLWGDKDVRFNQVNTPSAAVMEPDLEKTVQGPVEQQINGEAAAPGRTEVRKVPADTSTRARPHFPVAEKEHGVADSTAGQLLENPPATTKKSRPPLLYFARPRLGLGLSAGSPLLEHKRSGFVTGAGLRADVEIARNIRLGTELWYQKTRIKADETDALEALGVEIPDPGSDFRLKYWETYGLPAFTYALQLRYEFPLRSRWTPWIGLGGQAATLLPFDIEYEFESLTNNLEIHRPGKTGMMTRWQGILFQSGLECRLNTHFYFGAEVYVLRRPDAKPFLPDNQFGLKTSLLYKF